MNEPYLRLEIHHITMRSIWKSKHCSVKCDNSMSNVNKVNFLWEAASLFPPDSHVNRLLKSYFLTTSQSFFKDGSFPQFSEFNMCSKCSTCWVDGNYKIKFIKQMIKNNKAKRLVNSLDSGDKLTKKQKIRAKWYKKRISNYLKITCLLCKHKTSICLHKPRKEEKQTQTTVTQVDLPTEIVKTKSKKKKKDKFAGLKINSTIASQITAKTNRQIANKTKSANHLPENNSKNHNNQLLTSSKNIHKTKSKTNIKNKIEHNFGSKTKKKNTLLQLAEMLKQNVKNKSPGQNDRLKNLLR